VWASPADENLTAAALWYSDQQPALDEAFLTAVREAARRAAESPQLYARVHRDLRRVLVHRFPYALLFRERATEIVVLACYHLHRDPSVWQSRG
jgi:plasmid stabilization system protein ParE